MNSRQSAIEDAVRKRCCRPCKDCKRRTPLCHAGCVEYARYKEEYARLMSELLLRNNAETEADRYIMESRERYIKGEKR